MVHLISISHLFLLAWGVGAMPYEKRISEIIDTAMEKWEPACRAAGGAGTLCNNLAVRAFSGLLFQAKPCDQQNAADGLISLAKTLQNSTEMITLAQIFAQQPRITPEAQSVPYCQSPPSNPELSGIYQCQFNGTDPTTFFGGAKIGEAGTIPYGLTSPVNPPGSCPAHPSGPIPDGAQLVNMVDTPFAEDSGTSSSATVSDSSFQPTSLATSLVALPTGGLSENSGVVQVPASSHTADHVDSSPRPVAEQP